MGPGSGACLRLLLLLLAVNCPPISLASPPDTARLLVQRSPLAGSQYHALAQAWPLLAVGDRLELRAEPDNRHDRHAVRVYWQGLAIGYVPRAHNRALAEALAAGETLEARVSLRRDDPDPWRKLEFEVWLRL